MRKTVIDWDGSNVPRELQILPPGRYLVAPLEDAVGLTREEDNQVRLGLDDVKAGKVVPLERVMQEIRGRLRRE